MRALAALVATVATLVGSEVALRLLAPRFRVTEAGMFARDPHRGYRLKAGYRARQRWGSTLRYDVTVNSLSQRGDELDPQAQCRLLAIGDSHTFAVGVEPAQTYPARLEALLRERTGRRIDVVNAGVPAYGWLEENDVLREFLATGAGVDLVLFQVSWNDVNDNGMGIPKFVIDGRGRLLARMDGNRPGGFGAWGLKTEPIGRLELAALSHSHLASLLIGRWRAAQYAWRRDEIERRIEGYKWQVSETVLGAMAERLRQAGLPVRAVVHPGVRPDDFDMHRTATDHVMEMLRRYSIEYVDLRPALEAHEDAAGLYLPGDEHFNAQGYEWQTRLLLDPVLDALARESRCLSRDVPLSAPPGSAR